MSFRLPSMALLLSLLLIPSTGLFAYYHLDDDQQGIGTSLGSDDQRPTIEQLTETGRAAETVGRGAQERSEQAFNEGLVSWSNFAIAVLTFFMVSIAAFQAWLFKVQLGLMGETLKDTKAAAEAAQQSTRIAIDTFYAAHRPKLRIKLIRIHPLVIGDKIKVLISVTNIGDTSATIVRHEVNLTIERRLEDSPQRGPYYGTALPHKNCVIAAGQTRPIEYPTTLTFREAMHLDTWGGDRLKITGILEYQDLTGIGRRTGFQRFYNAADQSYVKAPEPNSAFEYED